VLDWVTSLVAAKSHRDCVEHVEGPEEDRAGSTVGSSHGVPATGLRGGPMKNPRNWVVSEDEIAEHEVAG
jgi:hypothetical protein